MPYGSSSAPDDVGRADRLADRWGDAAGARRKTAECVAMRSHRAADARDPVVPKALADPGVLQRDKGARLRVRGQRFGPGQV
jgi:hypothetical protein